MPMVRPLIGVEVGAAPIVHQLDTVAQTSRRHGHVNVVRVTALGFALAG